MKIILYLFFIFFINIAYSAKYSIEHLGDIINYALPAFTTGLTIANDDYKAFSQFGLSFIGTQLAISKLQKIVKEPRPNGGKNGFPSGHAGSVFSSAMFIHRKYGIEKAIIPYSLALFTGFSRVYSRWHYTHDVLGSILISGLFTWMIVDKEDTNIIVSGNDKGASLNFSFKF